MQPTSWFYTPHRIPPWKTCLKGQADKPDSPTAEIMWMLKTTTELIQGLGSIAIQMSQKLFFL